MKYLDAADIEFTVIRDKATAQNVISSFTEHDKIAVDLETTALRPEDGYVRITTLWSDKFAYVFDHAECGSFEDLAPLMVEKPTFVCFHIMFEGLWFDWFAPDKITLWDVAFMRKSVQGGGGYPLARMAQWDLDVDMSKALQTSDWGAKELTDDQYRYAAYDGYVTWELFTLWRSKMSHGHWNGFHIINNAWRANLEMQATALYLDVPYHRKNVKTWELKRATALKYFERFTPKGVIANIASNKQISNFLKSELSEETIAQWPTTGKTGDLMLEQAILKKVAARLPYPMNRWMAALIIVRYYNKYLSTYGEKMINSQNLSGKLHTKFNMAAAVTCRYSSSSHNLQNIPRKPYIRKAFTVRAGRNESMVLADYSGIEVRVAAEISGDAQLLHDTTYGNVHGTGAALIHGIDEAYFLSVLEDKEHPDRLLYKSYRQVAKVFTFRLLYGAGLGALADSLKSDTEHARLVVERWAERYKRAYRYRFQMQEEMMRTGYLPVCDGRTIYVRKSDRQLPVAANYPIQGAAASVMYAAVSEVRKELVTRDIDAELAACVHDEILMYSHVSNQDSALEALESGMTKGWLTVFPNSCTDNLLESAIGHDWAAKP